MPPFCRSALRSCLLLGCAVLSGCASLHAVEGRHKLVGMALEQAETCLGVPAETERLGVRNEIAQWNYAAPTSSATLPISDLALMPVLAPLALTGSVSLTGAGSCQLIAHVVDDRITSVVYAGESGGITGPEEKCASLVRGCLWMLKHPA